jgi:F-type H+-transporting ATPase subunit alpha
MEEQVVALYAGNQGYLDDIPVAQIPRFHDELRESLKAEGTILQTIRETGDLADDVVQKLDEEIKRFKNGFHVEEEHGLVA